MSLSDYYNRGMENVGGTEIKYSSHSHLNQNGSSKKKWAFSVKKVLLFILIILIVFIIISPGYFADFLSWWIETFQYNFKK